MSALLSSSEEMAPVLADTSAFMRAMISAAVAGCDSVLATQVSCERSRSDVKDFNLVSFELETAFWGVGGRGVQSMSWLSFSSFLGLGAGFGEGRIVRVTSTCLRTRSFGLALPGSEPTAGGVSETRRFDIVLDAVALGRFRLETISELSSDTPIADLEETVLGVIASEDTSTTIGDFPFLDIIPPELAPTILTLLSVSIPESARSMTWETLGMELWTVRPVFGIPSLTDGPEREPGGRESARWSSCFDPSRDGLIRGFESAIAPLDD